MANTALTISRNSVAWAWDGAQFVEYAANKPRYSPVLSYGVSALGKAGLATPAGSTNRFPLSVDSENDLLICGNGYNLVFVLDKNGTFTQKLDAAEWSPGETCSVQQVTAVGSVWYVWYTIHGEDDGEGGTGYLYRVTWTDFAAGTFTAVKIFTLSSDYGDTNQVTVKSFAATHGSFGVSSDGKKIVMTVYGKHKTAFTVPFWYTENADAAVPAWDIIYTIQGAVDQQLHGHSSVFDAANTDIVWASYGDHQSGISKLTKPVGWAAGDGAWSCERLYPTQVGYGGVTISAASIDSWTVKLSGESGVTNAWINKQAKQNGLMMPLTPPATGYMGGWLYETFDVNLWWGSVLSHNGTIFQTSYYNGAGHGYAGRSPGNAGIWVSDYLCRTWRQIYRCDAATDSGFIPASGFVGPWNEKLWGVNSLAGAAGVMMSIDMPVVRERYALRLQKGMFNHLRLKADSCFRDATGVASQGSWIASTVGTPYGAIASSVFLRTTGGIDGGPCLECTVLKPASGNTLGGVRLNQNYAAKAWCRANDTKGVGYRITITAWVKAVNHDCRVLLSVSETQGSSAGVAVAHAKPVYHNVTVGDYSRVPQGCWVPIQLETVFDLAHASLGCFSYYFNVLADAKYDDVTFLLGGFQVTYDSGRHFYNDFQPALVTDPDTTCTLNARPDESAVVGVSGANQFTPVTGDYTLFFEWHPDAGYAEFTDRALPQTATSITSSGTTATVTSPNHCFSDGDSITISGATGDDAALYNGTFTIAGVATNTFTYTMGGTPAASPATGTILSTKTWPGDSIGLCYALDSGTSTGIGVRWDKADSKIHVVDSEATDVACANAIEFRHNDAIKFSISCDVDGSKVLYVNDLINGTQTVDLSSLSMGGFDDLYFGADGQSNAGHGLFLGFVLARRAFTASEINAAWLNPATDATDGLVDVGTGDYPEPEAYVPKRLDVATQAATQAADAAAVQAAAGQILDPASAVAADVGDGTITIGDIVIPGTYILRGGVVSASFEGFD